MNSFYIGNYAIDGDIIEKILWAIAILAITWILATVAKWAAAKMVDRISLLQTKTSSGETVGLSIGKIVSLLVWLFGIVAILQVFRLDNVIGPIDTMLRDITDFLPNLLGAGLFFFVGLIIARIVRQLIETTLATVDLDKWAARGGVTEVTGSSTISKTIANVVFALIMIVVAIGALGVLQVEAISGPATEILQNVAAAIPRVFGAAILLGLSFFLGRWAADLMKQILANMGADQAIASVGILPSSLPVSSLVGRIAQLAIVLFGAIAATRLLAFPELTAILNEILDLGGRVVFGSVIIAVGVLLANLISNLVASTTGENGLISTMLKYLIIAVATFMGLTHMQIGEQIVIIAFSGFVFAAAVASAIAFGLGGREAAARQLKKMQDAADARPAISSDPAPKTPSAKAAEENKAPEA